MECYPLLGGMVELVLVTGSTSQTDDTTSSPWLDLNLTNFTGRLIVRPRTVTTDPTIRADQGGYQQQQPTHDEEMRTNEPLGSADDSSDSSTLVDHNLPGTTTTTASLPPIAELASQSDFEVDEIDETAKEKSQGDSSSPTGEEVEETRDTSERVVNDSALEATDSMNLDSTDSFALEASSTVGDSNTNEVNGGSDHVASKSPLDRLKRAATGAVASNIISGISGHKPRRALPSSTENSSQHTSFLKWGGGGGSSHSKRSNPSKEKPVSRSLSWHKLMQIYSVKKHIPPSVRQKRLEQRRATSRLVDSDTSVPFTTVQSSMTLSYPSRLHELCGEPDATLSELLESLETNKQAVFQTDHLGRLPLHILGDNEGLIGSSQGKQVASAFAWKLMEANPDALVAVDNQGLMPFVQIIVDWIQWVYESHKLGKQAATPQSQSRGDNSSDGRAPITSFPFSRNCEEVSELTRMFPTPEVWDEVEWCLNMISLGMDELAGKSGLIVKASKGKKTDAMRRDIACHLISTVPELVKTVLLIESEGGETRRRIVRTSLFRRIFLCKECVGEWLTLMLRKAQPVSRRGVDLLEYFSGSTISDYTGGFRAATPHDAERYHEERNSVFEAVNKLDGTLASLAMLENRETERAAGTPVIWFMMRERLTRPFVLGLVLVDLILHISLMIAFRNSVRLQESVIGAIDVQSANFICVHYLLRKGCEALALLSISPSLLKKFARNLWTIVDILTILLTMVAFTWSESDPNTYRNGFNALVVGLLWVKVVGFLKVVNQDMSTFILALLDIIGDIKYFLVVLVVVIFMFGDVFHLAVSTKDNGVFCQSDDLEGPTEDFCSPTLGSYLRVYSMLIGDFELNDLKDTTGITTIYVIFTSLGVVLLLNVLIAVICRSYEKATDSSAKLFGRARVNFIAQNEALEIFLHPGAHAQEAFRRAVSTKMLLSRLFRIFRLFTLFAILATALTTAMFLASHGIKTWMRSTELDVPTSSLFTATLMLVLFLILIFALAVLIGFSLESLVEQPSLSTTFGWINNWTYSVVSRLALPLFGTHSREQASSEEADEKEDSLQMAVESTKKEMISEMSALETRLCEHFAAMLEDRAAQRVGRKLTRGSQH